MATTKGQSKKKSKQSKASAPKAVAPKAVAPKTVAPKPNAPEAEASSSEQFDGTQTPEAFESMRDEAVAIPAGQILVPRVETQRSAAIALRVAERDSAPPREPRFAGLAKLGEFDIDNLYRLRTFALGNWYARRRQIETEAIESNAVVPADIVQSAQETRARMLRLLEYHFDTDPEILPRLAYIRSGSGYLDLANDLQGLASIYGMPGVLEQVESDRKQYRKGDPKQADLLASSLMTALGVSGTPQAEGWSGLAQRSWTMLFKAYSEVQAAGSFLFRNEEDVTATYPSLVTVARAARTTTPNRSEAPDEVAENDEDEPTSTEALAG